MGIPSLNSAIFYNISLYFPFTDPSPSLRMTPKSCKYNKYPGPSAKKRSLFMANELIFDSSAKKTAVFCGRE